MGQITSEEATQKKAELDAVIQQHEKTGVIDWQTKANEIVDINVEIVDTLKNGTITEKRELLTRLGSNLVWNEEKLSILNRISIDTLIKGLKQAKLKNPQFEPRFYEACKDKTDVFASVRPNLLRTLDAFRTINWRELEREIQYLSVAAPHFALQSVQNS